MKNFLEIYRGEPSKGNAVWESLSPQEREKRQLEGMQAWGAWMQKHETNIVYTGGPLGKTLQTDKNGVSAQGDRTKIMTIFDAEGENPLEMQRNGWQAILDNFKKYVETA